MYVPSPATAGTSSSSAQGQAPTLYVASTATMVRIQQIWPRRPTLGAYVRELLGREVVPGLVELEVAVPRLKPAVR